MKYFAIITLALVLIHMTNGISQFERMLSNSKDGLDDFDYDDDADPYSGLDDEEDEPAKPIYKLEEAPKLFEKFMKDYDKTYKNNDDLVKHYNTFVQTLKEINSFNSDKEFSSTVDINIFADISPDERREFLGGPEA